MPKAKQEPDYRRAFDQVDFRGYFQWTEELSESVGGKLYHACHGDELNLHLAHGKLTLESEWQLNLPQHGKWTVPGIWVGLNEFRNGNYYGPCLFSFPITVLVGRQFMVFRREAKDRKRYFFVQHESRIPIYTYVEQGSGKNKTSAIKKNWRIVNPESYFKKQKGKLFKIPGAIYDIVLTVPLDLTQYSVQGVDHPWCISGKCSRSNLAASEGIVLKYAKRHAGRIIKRSESIQALLGSFPCLEDAEVLMERI
jgi:hypothetical protein